MLSAMEHLAEALEHLRQVEVMHDGHRVLTAMAGVREALIEFGVGLQPGQRQSAIVLNEIIGLVYPRLRAAYQAAGYPCGPDEHGLWLWLRQQGAIAAEAERVERERAWQRALEVLRREVGARRAASTADS
jgi:hypothetical protein